MCFDYLVSMCIKQCDMYPDYLVNMFITAVPYVPYVLVLYVPLLFKQF